MTIRCCVCGADLGEKEPYEDPHITHTYCKACAKKALRDYFSEKRDAGGSASLPRRAPFVGEL